MSNFKQMVINEMASKERGYAKEIAAIAGYSSSTNLNKVLYGEKKEFKSFHSVLKMVRKLFPDREQEMMGLYIEGLDPRRESARYSLEYMWIEKMTVLLIKMIEEMKDCGNELSEEYAFVYDVDYKVSKGKMDISEAITKMGSTVFKSPEMKVFSKLVKFYCYYDMRFFSYIKDYEKEIVKDFKEIGEDYIKHSYKSRLGLMKTDISIHTGDEQRARKYGMATLGFCVNNSISSLTSLQIGNSYMFENKDQSLRYLYQAKKLACTVKTETEAKRSINFVSSLWNLDSHELDFESKEVSDIHEVAHYYISKNNPQKALEILDGINQENLTGSQLGFHFYYRGKAENNSEHFFKSIEHFNSVSEIFYKKAPLLELQRMGLNEYMIRALAN